MKFTPEELAELQAYDAAVDAEPISYEDYRRSREIERELLFPKSWSERRRAAQQKAYREQNREKVAAQQKAYREQNREKLAAQQKAYYEQNREKVAAQKKAYYEQNREKLAAQKKAIAGLRARHGYTQKDLSRLLGVSQSLVSQWETGQRTADWEALMRVLPECPAGGTTANDREG